jgi:hypothetical protein
MLTVRETARDCLVAIIRGSEAAPDERHIAILCELAEASDPTRAAVLDRRRHPLITAVPSPTSSVPAR